jgi:hypothetical protein
MAGLYTSSAPQTVKFPRHTRENLCSRDRLPLTGLYSYYRQMNTDIPSLIPSSRFLRQSLRTPPLPYTNTRTIVYTMGVWCRKCTALTPRKNRPQKFASSFQCSHNARTVFELQRSYAVKLNGEILLRCGTWYIVVVREVPKNAISYSRRSDLEIHCTGKFCTPHVPNFRCFSHWFNFKP